MIFAVLVGRKDEKSGKDTPMTNPRTQSLDVPGATLTYDVREAEADSGEPILLMIGSPMGAGGFTTLAGHFRDRTVVAYDPRGVGRSRRIDGGSAATPEEHAHDLHRLISELDAGPVDIFGSSGGAVNALALVAREPRQVGTLVAHEPPSASVLPDREEALAATADIHETYERAGLGPAMAKFISITSLKGPIPADFPDQAPNPADFGLPTEDDGSRDDPMVGPHIVHVTHYEPDFDALRAASTRIVVAAGAESEGAFTYRAALAVAEQLGTKAVIFPSHHGGFLGGEFGQTGDPDAFAATLRNVLTEETPDSGTGV
jgi:pimeloyl-ACP methyl ester carboxylesterase